MKDCFLTIHISKYMILQLTKILKLLKNTLYTCKEPLMIYIYIYIYIYIHIYVCIYIT